MKLLSQNVVKNVVKARFELAEFDSDHVVYLSTNIYFSCVVCFVFLIWFGLVWIGLVWLLKMFDAAEVCL